MMYSVYDYDRKVYSYYQGSGPKGTHAGAPPKRGRNGLGSTIEQSAWVLPTDARKVGEGDLPKGRIASRGGIGGGLGDIAGFDLTTVGMLGVAAFLAWRFLR